MQRRVRCLCCTCTLACCAFATACNSAVRVDCRSNQRYLGLNDMSLSTVSPGGFLVWLLSKDEQKIEVTPCQPLVYVDQRKCLPEQVVGGNEVYEPHKLL